MYDFDALVFIGRFQPFHNAHLKTIEIALQKSHSIIIALGSVQTQRSVKNPFFAFEREKMILDSFSIEDQQRIKFIHLIDLYNDEKWVNQVKTKVNQCLGQDKRVGLIGHFKDDTSYYLALFSEWQLVALDNLENALSATDIRIAYYQGNIHFNDIPKGTLLFLENFIDTEAYQQLKKDTLS